MIEFIIPKGVIIDIDNIRVSIPDGRDWKDVLNEAGMEAVIVSFKGISEGTVNIGTISLNPNDNESK